MAASSPCLSAMGVLQILNERTIVVGQKTQFAASVERDCFKACLAGMVLLPMKPCSEKQNTLNPFLV